MSAEYLYPSLEILALAGQNTRPPYPNFFLSFVYKGVELLSARLMVLVNLDWQGAIAPPKTRLL